MDYFDQKNAELFDFLNETFGIRKARSWKEISQAVNLLKVKLTYRKFAELFPRQINYSAELQKTRPQFTSIHYGTLKARTIIDEIVRFSLYSDRIIVFHPLQNPAVTNQNMNPGRNPAYWLPDFLDALYFYIVIQNWVRNGIVKLIIKPYEYDLKLRDKLDVVIKERVNKLDREKYFQAGKVPISEYMAEHFALTMKGRKKEDVIKMLLEIHSPVFTQSEAEEFANYIIEATPKINPLYEHLTFNYKAKSMLVSTKGAGPLESVLLVSDLTGGNIYTPKESTWMQIQDAGIDQFWTKVNQTYSKIPLNFLNGVETAFALELRKEDRLAGVRQEMKRIFGELKSVDIKELSETKFRDFHESFTESIRKAEAEWTLIEKQIRTKNIALASGVAVPLITNDFSWLPLAMSSLAAIYQNTSTSSQNKQAFRDKNPISVFVDLKKKQQGFTNSLKNCIF